MHELSITQSVVAAVTERTGDARVSSVRVQAEDISSAVSYIVTRPRHVAINEILIRPTEQDS